MVGVREYVASVAVLAAAAVTAGEARAGCAADPYIGSMCMTAAKFCPSGYLEADGRVLSVTENTTLYVLLEDQYGGDGHRTFALPDMRNALSAGPPAGRRPGNNSQNPKIRFCIAVKGIFPAPPH